jgi:hypothetical protein
MWSWCETDVGEVLVEKSMVKIEVMAVGVNFNEYVKSQLFLNPQIRTVLTTISQYIVPPVIVQYNTAKVVLYPVQYDLPCIAIIQYTLCRIAIY